MERNPWALYDELIAPIDPGVVVSDYQCGHNWTHLVSSEGGIGMAMTLPVRTRPPVRGEGSLIGRPLREVAQLAKSWNFVEAALGMAAVNAWYAEPARVETCGVERPLPDGDSRKAFDAYAEESRGAKVAVVGHFPQIEKRFSEHSHLSVLERVPLRGDYPDPACEYLLPEQDYVFITGSAFVNKTMPRLLELCAMGGATVVVLGPSTPLAPQLFGHGVDSLSGFVPTDRARLEAALAGPDESDKFNAGRIVDRIRG